MRERDLVGRRVVAVHAHPDDESIATGGTLAQLARRGADVTVVTCTLGEEGEVIGEPFRHLVADHADQLGGFRIAELTQALSILGARGEFLGGAGYFRDSGMVGSPAHNHPRAFVSRREEAVEALAATFRRLRPELVITYGPDGGYGHPDHIQAHHITHDAARLVPVPRIVWACADREEIDAALGAITSVPDGWKRAAQGEIPGVDGYDAVVELTDSDYHAKREAMRAHATQLWIADGSISTVNPHAAHAQATDHHTTFALSNLIAQPLMQREHYRLGAGVPFTDGATDLFNGI